MPSLDEEAFARAQHILDLPHERKNMSTLVTTLSLQEAGFLSPQIGSKVGFKVFRDGKPLVDRKHKYTQKRARGQSPDNSSDQGMAGRVFSFLAEDASYILSKIISTFMLA